MNTPRRTIRIEDELWTAAADKANEEGTTVTDIIRTALRKYVAAGAAVVAVFALGAAAPAQATEAGPTDLRITTLDVQALACDSISLSGNLLTPECSQIILLDSAQDLIDTAFAPFTSQF